MNDDRPAFLDPTIGIAGEPSLCKALMSELKAKGATVGASIETADCVVFAAGQNVSPTLVDALDLARGRATELSRFRTLIAISAPPDANHSTNGMVGSVSLGGFFKSAALELDVSFVNLLLEPDAGPATLADRVLDALKFEECSADVKSEDGRYLLGDWSEDTESEPRDAWRPDRGTIVAVTGGARGITLAICRGIASRWGCTLEICGRSAPMTGAEREASRYADKAAFIRERAKAGSRVGELEREWRELGRRTEVTRGLMEVERLGANVHYTVVDAGVEAELGAWLNDVRRKHGRIDVIVHGAGIVEDCRIAEKTAESLSRVLAPKLGGFQAIVDSARATGAYTMMFSSVAAVFGSAGQADYAAANENLSAAALRHLPDGVVIHWGAWNDMGMTAGAISTRLADAGAPLLGTIDGVAACVDAFAAKTTGEMIVMGASE